MVFRELTAAEAITLEGDTIPWRMSLILRLLEGEPEPVNSWDPGDEALDEALEEVVEEVLE